MKSIRYIFSNERDEQWGLTVTTVGFEKIEPGEPYPSNRHLEHYLFSPEEGRVLQEYQLVYVSKGTGTFKSATLETVKLSAGSLFILFPGEWHTYTPDPDTGWDHYWIGFKGTDIDTKVARGFFTKDNPVINIGYNAELIDLFNRALDVADKKNLQFQQVLAGLVNHMLSLFYAKSHEKETKQPNKVEDSINLACRLMHEGIESTLSVIEVANRVGLGYSTFRKQFKNQIGVSPFSYFQDLKIERAKHLLSQTPMSIKEIAYKLNFKSADYFSAQFKKITGYKPSNFRSTPPHQ
ncbi:MAG: AraC family transcriptional regulator [Muribaculaceae bacterium]|nr:AraC family transcriptional regulator [Muribaculaceae bacterium]